MDTHIGSSLFQEGHNVEVNIDNAAQNFEEEEEKEDQRRLQGEMQALLTNAMDDFNYDDPSTVNSSVNESAHFAQEYKEATLDNQLAVLYRIRVKEVEDLTERLHAIEQNMKDSKSLSLQKLMLAEAESDRLKVSLKNAQELLADKHNAFEEFEKRQKLLQNDIEVLRSNHTKIEKDNGILQYMNKELTEKVAILEQGRSLNPLNEGLMHEQYERELGKLQKLLENATAKLERYNTDNVNLTKRLNAVTTEKEELMASKADIINNLMQNVEQAQSKNRELLLDVSKLNSANEKLKSQVNDLESNMKLMKGFTDKTEIIKILQNEVEKYKVLSAKQCNDYNKLTMEFAEMSKLLKEKNAMIKLMDETIHALQNTPLTESNSMQTSKLMESFSVSESLREELAKSKQTIAKRDANIALLNEKVVVLEADVIKLNKKLDLTAERDHLINELKEKATKLQEMINNNQKTTMVDVSMNTEEMQPVEIPKQPVPDEMVSYYRTKYESDLIEKEIMLREQIQLEYRENYKKLKQRITVCDNCAKLTTDFVSLQNQIVEKVQHIADLEADIAAKRQQIEERNNADCELCMEMSEKLTRNIEVMQTQEALLEKNRLNQERDRELIVKMLGDWKARYEHMEHENQVLRERLDCAMKGCTSAQTELAMYRSTEEQLVQALRVRTQTAVREWSHSTLERVKQHNNLIRSSKDRIESISLETDTQVKQIEKTFNQAQIKLSKNPLKTIKQ